MISAVEKSLYTFWSGFGVPAYKQGMVPSGNDPTSGKPLAPLPYITYAVGDGDTFGQDILTAFVWAKNDSAGLTARRTVMDAVAQKIQYGGLTVPVEDGGYLFINRNSASWQSLGKDEDDDTVLYGRISYEIEYMHM